MKNGDGNVVINVDADDSQAQKRLTALNRQINKLTNDITENENARLPITQGLKEAQDQAIETYNRIEQLKAALAESEQKTGISGDIAPDQFMGELEKQKQIKAEIAEAEKLLAKQEAAAQKLEAQDEKILQTLEQQRTTLASMTEEAGAMTKALDAKSTKVEVSDVTANVKKGLSTILKWGIGIRSLYALVNKLRSYIKSAVTEFAKGDKETQTNINALKSSLATLKASWGAAFAPILNAVTPMLQTLIQWLTAAANAINAFFSALSGKGTFKKVVSSTGELADNLEQSAGSAGDTKKQLMGIDELNVASDSGGGGGGSSSPFTTEDEEIADGLLDKMKLIKDAAMAIGAAILAWGITSMFTNSAKTIWGIMIAVAGAVLAIAGGFDAWKNGVDWTNLAEMIGGVALAAAGLALAFGGTAAAIALIVGGIGMLVIGIRDWIKDGELAHETAVLIAAGFLAIGVAISLLTGSWIPILIAAVIGIATVIYSYWGEISAWFTEKVVNPLKLAWEKICQTASSALEKLLTAFQNVKNKIISVIDKIKSAFSFNWSLPHISLPHLTVTWQPAGDLGKFFGISAIPHLGIQWYAKGGIVDGATLIGAGEAGKEAIIPLERNTGWITMVAKELADILGGADMLGGIGDKIVSVATAINSLTQAINSLPMPAVASGSIVPPNAYNGSNEVMDKLADLLTRLENGERIVPMDIRTTVTLDRRVVGESVTRYQAERSRARG